MKRNKKATPRLVKIAGVNNWYFLKIGKLSDGARRLNGYFYLFINSDNDKNKIISINKMILYLCLNNIIQ